MLHLNSGWKSTEKSIKQTNKPAVSRGGNTYVILLQSNAKLKLVRSLAVCEESSGPFSNDGPPESVPFPF